MGRVRMVMTVFKELREHIELLISSFGIKYTEQELGIVVMGIRKTGIENVRE